MTRNEAPVAIPPRIAKTGQSTPPIMHVRPAAVEDVSVESFCFIRSRTSDACATVNESVAPNE